MVYIDSRIDFCAMLLQNVAFTTIGNFLRDKLRNIYCELSNKGQTGKNKQAGIFLKIHKRADQNKRVCWIFFKLLIEQD